MSWKFNRKKWKKPANNRPKAPSPILFLEQLEKRWLMAVDLQLYNQTPVVEATPITNRLLGRFAFSTGNLTDYTAMVYWGDSGSPTPATLSAGATSTDPVNIIGSHTFSKAGSYTVQVAILYLGNYIASSQAGWVIDDAPLTASFVPFSTTEGDDSSSVAVARFTDPASTGHPTDYSAIIDWGDGSQTPGQILWDYINNCFDVDETSGGVDSSGSIYDHIYEQHGQYHVSVTITDSDGSSAITEGDTTVSKGTFVSNVFPGSYGPYEYTDPYLTAWYWGSFYYPRYDKGPFVATWNWGDGTSSSGTVQLRVWYNQGIGYVHDSHAFVLGGGNSITLSIVNTQTGDIATPVTYSPGAGIGVPWDFPETTYDASMPISGLALSGIEDNSFSGTVASFTPTTDPWATFSATIYWGDQSYSDGTIVSNSDGTDNIQGAHTYSRAGDYEIWVELKAEDIYSQAYDYARYGYSSIVVTPSSLALVGSNLSTSSNATLNSVTVATFSDSDLFDLNTDFLARIDWGDGTSTDPMASVVGSAGVFSIAASHTYVHSGTYKTSVLLSKAGIGGSFTTDSLKLVNGMVAVGVLPTVNGTLTGAAEDIDGAESVMSTGVEVASFSDSNASGGPYSANINWGDGQSSTCIVSSLGSGNYRVLGSHKYAKWGSYGAEVTIVSGTSSLDLFGTALISHDAINLAVQQLMVGPSGTGNGIVVASFSCSNLSATASDFVALVEWGLESRACTVVGGNGQFYVTSSSISGGAAQFRSKLRVTVFSAAGSASHFGWGLLFQPDAVLAQGVQSVEFAGASAGELSNEYPFAFILPGYSSYYPYGWLGTIVHWGSGPFGAAPPGPNWLPTGWAPANYDLFHPHPTLGHVFAQSGSFEATAAFEGGTVTDLTYSTVAIDVAPALPKFKRIVPVIRAIIGRPIASMDSNSALTGIVSLAEFVDADSSVNIGDFSAVIDWGDGQQSPGLISEGVGVYRVDGAHTYQEVGNFTVLIELFDARANTPIRIVSTYAVVPSDGGLGLAQLQLLHQRLPGTLLDVGSSPSADGGQAAVAPNTGTLQIYQPLDPRLSHDASRDSFIDVNGNPLQGMTSGDGRLSDLPAGATSGPNSFDALVYSSDSVDPRPIAEAYASFNPANGVPYEIDVTLTWNGLSPQSTVVYTVATGHLATDTYLVGDQVASVVSASGAYPWSMTAEAFYSGGGNQTLTFNGTALVDNENASPFGPGWTLDGLNRLVVQSNGVLMLMGSGAAPQWYPKDGSGNFPTFDAFFGTLAAAGAGYTYTSKYGIVWNYDSTGNLTSITDPHSLAATFTYSGGNPATLAWPDGGTTTFAYSGSVITAIQEPGTRTLSLAQTSNLTGITDVDGTSRTFGYDSHHHLTSLNWAPLAATYAYDSTSGVLTGVSRGLGTNYTLRPSNEVVLQTRASAVGPDAAVAQWTDPRSHLSTYTLDQLGWVGQLDTPDNAHQYWYRDLNEQVVAHVDQNGHATQHFYDNSGTGKGDEFETLFADGSSEAYSYDSTYHRETRLVDGDGNVTTYSYNGNADLTQIQEAAGASTFYGWSSNGLETSSTDGRGYTTTYQYQSAPSRLLADTIDPLTYRTTYAYDGNGYLSGVQNPRTFWTTYTNDARGRTTLEHHADGGLITMAYDAIGDLTSQQDPNPLLHPVGYAYDQRGWLTSTLDNWGGYVYRAYDVAGNETVVVDQVSQRTSYSYDVMNRQTTIQSPIGGLTTMKYDPAGNLTASTDPDNRITTYSYDSLNRQIQVEDARQGYATTTYDGAGNVLSEENGDLEFTYFGYDKANRQTSVTDALGHTALTVYDNAGNVSVTVDDLGKRTTFSYDADERQTLVEDPRTDFSSTSYDQDGNVAVSYDFRNKATTYAYDSMDRQQSVQDPDNGTTTTVYDKAGNVISITDPYLRTTTYGYDAVNRIKTIEDPDGDVTTIVYYHDGTENGEYDPNGHIPFGAYYDGDKHVIESFDVANLGTGYAYDKAGDLTAVTDIHGNVVTYAYDGLHRLTQVTHPLGDTEKWSYDAVGNTLSYTNGLNKTTTYQYDADNHQTLVIHPLLDTEATHYDADGHVTSVTDGNGNTTTYQYDDDGNRTSIIDALGNITTQTFDEDGNVTQVTQLTSAGTSITTYQYDAADRQTLTINARTARTTTTYDANGRVSTVQDPAGTVVNAYDPAGRLTNVTDRRGISRSTSYDRAGRVTATTTGKGGTESTAYVITPYAYESTGVTDPAGNVFGWTYYDDGDFLSGADPLAGTTGNAEYSTYDPDNRLTYTRDEKYRSTWLHYDAAGQVTARQVDDLWATYTYDDDGRVLTEKGPLVDGASYGYDGAGNVTSMTNGVGETTTYRYDPLNRVTDQIDALNHHVTTTYDSVGNVLSVKDSDNNLTTYAYDLINERTSSTDAAGHQTSWAYNLAGQMTAVTDANNRTIQKTYDGNGNVTGETWLSVGGTSVQDTLSYQYDADNMVTVARNNAGTYTMSYDLDDRLTSIQEPFGASLTYAYDGMGDVTLQQDSFGGVITSTYDADQELLTRQFTQGGAVPEQIGFVVNWLDAQKLLYFRYSDAALTNLVNEEAFGYVGTRIASQTSFTAHGIVMTQHSYAYKGDGGATDGQGQVTSRVDDSSSTTTYTYDAAGQLSTSQNNLYGNQTYSYDAAGNSAAAGTTIGTGNQISTDGTWNYYYDNVGNRIAKINIAAGDGWSYVYDDANRLIDVKHYSSHTGSTPSGTVLLEESFTYDVFSNRLSDTLTQSSTTTITRFAYDQHGNAWADLNGSNQLVTRRFYRNGVDQLFARIDAATGQGYYYVTDNQGSVVDILDASTGSVVDRLGYDAYGNLLYESASAYGDRYKYTGREWDAAIGLQYNRGDWLDPVTRTWISQDPIQADPLKNYYRYVENDPTDKVDPSGESPDDVLVLQQTQNGYRVNSMTQSQYNRRQSDLRDKIDASQDALNNMTGLDALAAEIAGANTFHVSKLQLEQDQIELRRMRSYRLAEDEGTVRTLDLKSLQFQNKDLNDAVQRKLKASPGTSLITIATPSYRPVTMSVDQMRGLILAQALAAGKSPPTTVYDADEWLKTYGLQSPAQINPLDFGIESGAPSDNTIPMMAAAIATGVPALTAIGGAAGGLAGEEIAHKLKPGDAAFEFQLSVLGGVSGGAIGNAISAGVGSVAARLAPKNAGLSSPLPESYINSRYTVNMEGAPAGSGTNAAGFARNGRWFWRQMLNDSPELFSEANATAIRAGRSPTVDAKWVEGNPTHASFLGDTLIHHHIDQGSMATALPQRVHRAWHGVLHPD
jgi:RHS repeat-associated protein